MKTLKYLVPIYGLILLIRDFDDESRLPFTAILSPISTGVFIGLLIITPIIFY
jgi:hypothetical protein